jgi:raffinose/stachyose/melibiose transport system substrate-binding protein
VSIRAKEQQTMPIARRASILLALGLAALVAGCGTPGGDGDQEPAEQAKRSAEPIDVAKAGDVTLTVWDQEVRGGQAAQIKRLNREFQRRYPNVKIERVARSFEDLQRTLKLAVSDDEAPDVVQANQGRSIMGQLVKGRLLQPLDRYAEAYGWAERWSRTLLDLNRFSADGRQFGSGNLYGVSQMGEIVGVFYNKDKVAQPPRTFAEFERQLAEAKRAGEVGIAFGNLDKWPGIHEFQTVQNQFADRRAVRDFVFARGGASFATSENERAAAKLQEWARNGYFTPDFNGTGYDPAWQQFTKGKGRFLIAGTWVTADLADAMGDRAGFMLMPPADAGSEPVALGGESLPWAITAKSRNADVAAAYIDFLTNADAARVLVETNNLPAMKTDVQPSAALNRDVFAAWKRLSDVDGLVPYLDYATPTFYDDVSGAIQRLLGDRVEPRPFTEDVQEDYAKFTEEL